MTKRQKATVAAITICTLTLISCGGGGINPPRTESGSALSLTDNIPIDTTRQDSIAIDE